ncbi:MAG: DEAD/DEAH box helicase [Roseibacillus sp.]
MEDFETFVSPAVIALINVSGGETNKLQLAQCLCDVYTPEGILLDKKGRRCVLRHFDESEVVAFLEAVNVDKGDDPWETAVALNYDSSLEDQLLEFFGLIKPVYEEREAVDLCEQSELISPKYALFEHQMHAAEKVTALLRKGGRTLLHMPTGSGKTRTAMRIICQHLNDEIRSGDEKIVFWLADTEELCSQAAEEFDKAWSALGMAPKRLTRLYGAYSCPLSDLQPGIVVASLQKLNAAFKDQIQRNQILSYSSLVVFDEAHRILAPTYDSVVTHLTAFSASLLGLSATPGRSTENEEENAKFAQYFNKNKVMLEVKGFDSPIQFLQAEGYLSFVEYRPLKLAKSDLFFSSSELERLDIGEDFTPKMLERLGEDTKRNFEIILRTLDVIARGLPTILFACSVAHAEALTALLIYKGVKVGLVTGKTPGAVRSSRIAEYKSGEIEILINYGVLTTGFDAPQTQAVIITRPTTSLSLYSQMVGRATRGPKVNGTKSCEVHTVIDSDLPAFTSIAESFNHWNSHF